MGSYRFVYGGTTIGVFSIKNIREQLATAIRTRYPQHHRSIWRVAAVSLFEAVFLLGPFIVLASTLFVATPAMVVLLAAAAAFFLTLLHLMITVRTNPGIWWLSVISYPFVVLSELVIMQLSMYRYEFSEVDWKGRNVCTPLMLQAIPALPTIDEPPADKRSRKAAT